MSRVNQELGNGDLLTEFRSRNHCHITYKHKLVIVRVIYYTHVAKKSLWRQKACLLIKDATEELVGRAKSLHQHISGLIVNHSYGRTHSLELYRLVHDGEFANFKTFFSTYFLDTCPVAYEDSLNESHLDSPI